MSYAYWTGSNWQEIIGPFTLGGITYQPGWAESAADADRAALKVAAIVEPGDPPTDVQVIGSELVDTTSGPARHWTTSPYSVADATSIVSARADAVRDAECSGGCDTSFGRVDTSDSSKVDMVGAVLMAMLAKQAGQTFSIGWTMVNKTIQTLDADGMIALGLAVGQHRQACENARNAIRAKIDQTAAKPGATAADLFAIDINAGY